MEATDKTVSPYKGDKSYIFVSYSHRNTPEVLRVIKQLQNKQYRVWYDEGIDPGTEWDENIASHVEQCECFIAFLSEEYLESSNCKDELNYARELDKPRLLIYLEDITLPGGMRMRLNRLQAIHMYKYENLDNFYEKLYEFEALKRCREQSPNQAKRELTIQDGRSRYTGTLIGQGFASSVYKAYDEARKKDIVFKLYNVRDSLHIPLFTQYDLEDDLIKLQHDNLCGIIDVVRGNAFAIVMEYLEGETLFQYLRKNKPTVIESISIIRQVLNALKCLHDADIYYGDLTPNNIMISNQKVILCDFSASNYNGSRYDTITMILYKYHSPDRDTGKRVTFKSDIFEAGMILDTLTLNLVSEDTAHFLMGREELPLEESDSFTQLEKQLFHIIQKATRRNPEERYPSVSEMLVDLDVALALAEKS